jgi:hypothetical protein
VAVTVILREVESLCFTKGWRKSRLVAPPSLGVNEPPPASPTVQWIWVSLGGVRGFPGWELFKVTLVDKGIGRGKPVLGIL